MPNGRAAGASVLAGSLLVYREEETHFCRLQRVNAGQEYGDDQKMHANKYGTALNNLLCV